MSTQKISMYMCTHRLSIRVSIYLQADVCTDKHTDTITRRKMDTDFSCTTYLPAYLPTYLPPCLPTCLQNLSYIYSIL